MRFKTIGWVNGSHEHEEEVVGIDKDVTVLVDICPICNRIDDSENGFFRGEGDPCIIGGIKGTLTEDHNSKYHGQIPEGKRIPRKEIEQKIWDAFPDFKLEYHLVLTSDEYFVVEGTLGGTFTNPLDSPRGIIQPTGKKSPGLKHAAFL